MTTQGIPQSVEDTLWRAVRARLPENMCTPARLAPAVTRRSRRYTDARHELGAPLEPGEALWDLAARALFFTVADAAKVQLPLAELQRASALPERRPLRVLDVGAGAGAMSLGMWAAGLRPLAVRAADRDAAALDVLRRVAAELDGLDVEVVSQDATRAAAGGPWDVAVAGSVLNELSEDAAWRTVVGMASAVADDGAVIIVEPALRETSRRLLDIRDRVIGEGIAHVFAPCTRQGAPCPALADERDWCHEDRPRVPLPSRAALISRMTGLRDDGLKFSYLVLRKQPLPLVDAGAGRVALRVVSQPRKLKGKLECFVCGDHGRTRLRLLKRDRSGTNRDFERARRGDVVLANGEVGDSVARDQDIELLRV